MKQLTNYRYYVLTGLLAISLLCLFADSNNEFAFYASKVVAAIAFYALCRLHKHWEAKGEIPLLTKDDIDEL